MSSSCNLDISKAMKALDKITILKGCPHCKQTLKKPYVLPCGHTVCKIHVCKEGRHRFNSKIVTCKLCGKHHEGQYKKTKNKFATDLVSKVDSPSMRSLYDFLRFFNVDKYDKKDSQNSKIVLENLNSICCDLKNDPFTVVFNEINEIMNELQLQKVNKLKISVENESEEKTSTEKEERFIDELTAYRNECREHLNTIEFKEKRDKLIDDVEPQIKTCLKFLDFFKSTDDMTSINVANNKYVEVIDSKIDRFIQNELFLNKLRYYKDKMINFQN